MPKRINEATGTLPAPLTLAKLRHPHGSVPGNPLLAEPLYLTKYIERMGTGTGDMIERCRNAGLKEPEFTLSDGFVTTIRRKPGRAFEAVGGQSQPESSASPVPVQYQSLTDRILDLLKDVDLPTAVISQRLGQKRVSGQLKIILNKILKESLIEYTIPDKPNSHPQEYRLTEAGRRMLPGATQSAMPRKVR